MFITQIQFIDIYVAYNNIKIQDGHHKTVLYLCGDVPWNHSINAPLLYTYKNASIIIVKIAVIEQK